MGEEGGLYAELGVGQLGCCSQFCHILSLGPTPSFYIFGLVLTFCENKVCTA